MAREAIPPPYFITADDKRGLIVVTVAVVLAFVYVCSLIRISLRWQSRDWRADDWLLALATVSAVVQEYTANTKQLRVRANVAKQVFHTIQSSIIIHLVNLGLGIAPDGVPVTQLERLGKVSTPR
jgi:hypothetical protein